MRLRWADVRADSITLFDTKGRPERGARTHAVPIIKSAVRDLQSLDQRQRNHHTQRPAGHKSLARSRT